MIRIPSGDISVGYVKILDGFATFQIQTLTNKDKGV